MRQILNFGYISSSLCVIFPFIMVGFSPVRFSFNPPIGQVFAYHVVPEGSEGFSFLL